MDSRTAWQQHVGVGEHRRGEFGRVAGTDEHVPVRREDDGGLAGKQVNHWNGSTSAVVTPRTATPHGDLK